MLSTKGAYQSTNLMKFHVSGRKSENLHFDGILLSMLCTVLAEKYRGVVSHDTKEWLKGLKKTDF